MSRSAVAEFKKAIDAQLLSGKQIPFFSVGTTIRVHMKITDENVVRTQVWEGVCIARRNSRHSRADSTFTVLKISGDSHIVKTICLGSPNLEKVEVVSRASVKRAKLYYLENLRGKATRLKPLSKVQQTKLLGHIAKNNPTA